MKRLATLPFLALALSPSLSCAQPPRMDPPRQQAVVDEATDLILANYVHPERAKAVEAALRANLRAGKYRDLHGLDAFLDAVNEDMQAAGADRHLRIVYNPRIAAQIARKAEGSEADSPEFLKMLRESNFRLRRVESLEGNVGYFKFDNFVELRFVGDAFAGAMSFLHASSALILDLTDNGGGASETSDFLVSYFLPEGTRTGTSWERATGETTVAIVNVRPEVKQMLEAPLYVLVSERTASAAEAVAYTLQQAKRGVVVGSRTKGMANPGRQFLMDEGLFIVIPTILQKNAVSGTNWEGAGVVPDVEVASENALPAAMAHALKRLAGQTTDEKERYRLLFAAAPFAARVAPRTPPADFLEACVGEYGTETRIVREEGSLVFLKGEVHRPLSYMSDLTFTVEGRSDYRMRFPFENGQVDRCEVLWFDDTSDKYDRTR